MKHISGFLFRTALLLSLAVLSHAWASCDPAGSLQFTTLRPTNASYVYAQSGDAQNLLGAFWALGHGDPAVGAGHDNGSWQPIVEPDDGWIHSTGLPSDPYEWPFYILGDWDEPPGEASIDGCISVLANPEPPCMAILLADYDEACDPGIEACVSFAHLSAPRDGPSHFYFDQPGAAPIDLVPAPRVEFDSNLTDSDGAAAALLVVPPSVEEGLYLDPACGADSVVGYRIYETFDVPAEPPTLTGNSGEWRVPRGGAGPNGEPIPIDEPTLVYPGCAVSCFPWDLEACPSFAYTLVFDSGFELPYLTLLRNASPYSQRDVFLCCQDADSDGVCAEYSPPGSRPGDCDDSDPLTYPGAPELCDGVARDCDNPFWPEPPTTVDNDGDGLAGCEGDCADWSADIYPGAPELCDGLVANDCNRQSWPLPPDINDHDGDGFSECTGDCNQHDAAIYPGAPELCDGVRSNCSTPSADWRAVDFDDDWDGFSECEGDCDDTDASVFPGAPEACDGVAHDCNGTWPTPPDAVDDDGDGFAECDGDCDDSAPEVYPGAAEACDGAANDCNAANWPLPLGADDLDGDGFAECQEDCNDSLADVYPGATDSCNGRDDNCDGRSDEAPVFVRRHGNNASDGHFGLRIAAVNGGDEFNAGNFVVGARNDMWLSTPSGTATVFYRTNAASRIRLHHPQPEAGDHFGSSVTGIGDVDGDGFRDILVGAELDSTDLPETGSAHLFSGHWPFVHLAMLTDPAGMPGDRFGYNVSALGDLDGDDVGDFIVGSRGDDDSRGSATVFSGADNAVLEKLVDATGQAGDLFGYINAGAGDLNDDGVPDVLVGAYAAASSVAPGAGKVLAFSGSDFSFIRAYHDPTGTTGDEFGRGLAVLGDVSGDGKDDLLVGAPGKSGWGSVLLVSGADGVILDEITAPGGQAGDRFGYHVNALDDLDSDGVREILVGAFGDDTVRGENAGSASVYSGATRTRLRTLVDPDGSAHDLFGFSGAGVSDIDRDGVDEIVIGAYLHDTFAGENSGSVLVFAGSGIEDIDGDGFGDDCDPDRDGDGRDNEDDCAPSSADVTDPPDPVGPTLVWSSDQTTLWWQPSLQATSYRVYRAGSLQNGQFVYGPEGYFRANTNNRTLNLSQGSFFLVAAENECAVSHLGQDSAGNVRAMDR